MRAWGRRLLAGWTRTALVMQRVVTTVLFSAIYLVIVPWFALVAYLRDTMGLRHGRRQKTFWRPRRQSANDESEFERLG